MDTSGTTLGQGHLEIKEACVSPRLQHPFAEVAEYLRSAERVKGMIRRVEDAAGLLLAAVEAAFAAFALHQAAKGNPALIPPAANKAADLRDALCREAEDLLQRAKRLSVDHGRAMEALRSTMEGLPDHVTIEARASLGRSEWDHDELDDAVAQLEEAILQARKAAR